MPSKSKNQQKFMGIVHGVQKGEIDPNDVSKDIRDVADSITKKDAKDYASTKHKGLPTTVKKEHMDEIFEQLFNEGGFPDRLTPTDSFTEPGEDDDMNETRRTRIKQEIVKRLKEENLLEFPQNWMSGRTTNQHTAKRTKERDYDDERTNFITKNSGQPDLEEHHEDYPDEILQMSVGDFLTKLEEKDEELYHGFEDVIDKYIGDESIDEGWRDWFKKGKKPKVDHGSFKQQVLKALESALKDDNIYPGDIEEWLETKVTHRYGGYDYFDKDKWPERLSDKDLMSAKWIISDWERYEAKGDTKKVEATKKNLYNHLKKTLKESVDESAMGTIDIIAQESPNFKKFIQDVFKEFKDLDKTKESINWLKSIYDERTNESVNESISKAEIQRALYKPSDDYFFEKKGNSYILHLTSKDAGKQSASFWSKFDVKDNGKGYYGASYIISPKTKK